MTQRDVRARSSCRTIGIRLSAVYRARSICLIAVASIGLWAACVRSPAAVSDEEASTSGVELASPAIPTSSTLRYVDGSTLKMGRGYSNLSMTAAGDCIREARVTTATPNAGQRSEVVLREVRRISEISEALGASASASFGIGAFSSNALMEYAKSNHFNSHDYFLLLSIAVTHQTKTLSAFALTERASQVLREEEGRSRFMSLCGDEFVSGMVTGRRLTGIPCVPTSRETAIAGFLCTEGRRMESATCPSIPPYPTRPRAIRRVT